MKKRVIQRAKVLLRERYTSFVYSFFLFSLFTFFSGCSGRVAAPSIALALSGPALAIAGEYQGVALGGTMDRTCMIGVGNITLHSEQTEPSLICEGQVNTEPTEKGRVRGVLDCSEGQPVVFSLRNLGPDQGVGVGKVLDGSSALMLLFYHSSTEEAKRRFPEVKAEIEEAYKRKAL